MEKMKLIKIILTIILSIIEALISCWLYRNNFMVISNESLQFLTYIAPTGFLFFVNYWILSEILIYLGIEILYLFGHYKYITKKYNKITLECIAWLAHTNLHWGVIDKAKQCQNANTCEGILAIMKAGLENRYSNVYQEALSEVFNNITDRGLESKSLKYESVVCTAMILNIYAAGRKKSNKFYPQLNGKFTKIANNLWEARGKCGWGVFVEKAEDINCSMCNTFRSLIVLNEYNVCDKNEYYSMVRRIYETSNKSLFGFVLGDRPRLVSTAMSVVLYFNLDENIREKLDEVYNVKTAVNFVYKQFCLKGVETEVETFYGLESKSGGVKKAPWTHVTIAYSIDALTAAYTNKVIGIAKMNMLITRIDNIYNKRIIYINEDKLQCYYVPKDIEIRNDGIYTFPTAYFVMGISSFNSI